MFRTDQYALILFLLFLPTLHAADGSLAIIDAGVQSSEDAPFVQADYRFQPGDYVYATFQVAGFRVNSGPDGQTRKMAVSYTITPEDANGVALCTPIADKIEEELSSEDKNWTPKRRASFLLPSFVAAGEFHLQITVNDLLGKEEISKSLPFRIGGVRIATPGLLSVQDFQFLRHENDREALEVPAYAAGDSIFARFVMTGFKVDRKNAYHLSYGLVVLRPDGKPFLQRADAADLASDSFYPAQYVPGELTLTTSRNSVKGIYTVALTVRDLVGNTSKDFRYSFTVE